MAREPRAEFWAQGLGMAEARAEWIRADGLIRIPYVRHLRRTAVVVLPVFAILGALVTWLAAARDGQAFSALALVAAGFGSAGLATTAMIAWLRTNLGPLPTDDGVVFVDRRLPGERLGVHVVPWNALGDVVVPKSGSGPVGFRTAHYPLPLLVADAQARAILSDPRYRGTNVLPENVRGYLAR
jgi:hypothetical protein